MLKHHFAIVNFFRISFDVLSIGLIWNIVYFFRFYSGFFTHSGIPPYSRHLILTIPVVIIIYICRLWMGIYESIRIEPTFKQFRKQIESILLGFIFVVLFLYYTEKVPYTRILLLIFFFTLLIGLLSSHSILLLTLRYLRSHGYNLRHYGIIGTGKNAIKLMQDIQQCSYFGLNCTFFIDDKPHLDGKKMRGIPIHGHIDQLVHIVKSTGIDEVYLAGNGDLVQKLYPALEELQCSGITVRIVPDWGRLTAVSKPTTITVGSSVLLTASDAPLSGMNIILKDIFDRIVALLLLSLFSIPMLMIACAVKLTSRGPVFYKQKRIGMDQKVFEIIKFRTMDVCEEDESGWTVENDPRRTKLGTFLRSCSLDELPQLFNVIKGDMSLVGPRPEQPYHVQRFSEEYKKYMFRHKVKSGMTGWAQIHGFRGNTSLRKRIQYDINYIQNWSIWLDILILLRTPIHLLFRKNAY